MARYIDAEKLAQKVLELEDKLTPRKTFEAEIQYRFLVNVITPMIVSAPTEDVVSVMKELTWNYCPNCGAKMGEKD